MPTVGSLFSGIGGLDLGLERAGFTVAFQVENDPFCRRVLAARWPHAPRWDDVREWPSNRHESPDLLTGGFPCQDLSVAGKRAGLGGSRSSLFYEFVRIAQALKPTWGLVENVPGLLSSRRGADFALVLDGLRECWPVVGYRILDSQHFGVSQRRRRVFLVGGPTEAGVAQVLALVEGGGGASAASGEAGAHVAASLRSRSHAPGVNGPGRGGEDDVNLVLASGVIARYGKGTDSDATDTLVGALRHMGGGGPDDNEAQAGHLLVHALTAEGHDASEDGTGRGTPLVWPLQEVGGRQSKNQHGIGIGITSEQLMYTLQAGQQHGIGTPSVIRRLTPLECERLQAFPDGWTCLCQPLTAYAVDPDTAALACRCPDSPRYRALGNAVTVNVAEWIGRRLEKPPR